jgi:hypothetical protein
MTDSPPNQDEQFTEPKADREPTPEEAQAAERGASQVDIDQVEQHYQEMAELGKNVKGEGEIVPDDD